MFNQDEKELLFDIFFSYLSELYYHFDDDEKNIVKMKVYDLMKKVEGM